MKNNEKVQKFIIIGIVCAAILLITFTAYSIKNTSNSESTADETSKSESASTKMGKNTEEAKKDLTNNNTTFEDAKLVPNETNTASTKDNDEKKSAEQSQAAQATSNPNVDNESNSSAKNSEQTNSETKSEDASKSNENDSSASKEISFVAPVKGKIIRDFARDSLVYSDTLKEWITHNGIDIKSDKTSVVSSAADGKIFAIKNDPRYGLTVIISHDNGFQTVYSNLLTAEFVVEGEDVTAGQSIGTIGNSASFEVLDDYHLHFELLQNGDYLDPTIYVKFE